jgi:MFS family permease
LAGHVFAHTVATLIGVRLIAGAGQAAVLVATAALAADLAPPARRGEAASYVLVALQIGLGTGPLFGELLLEHGSYDLVWLASSAGAATCVLLGSRLKRVPVVPTAGSRGWVHPAGVRPGVVQSLGVLGFVGYLAFAPLYGQELGLSQIAPAFLLYSGTIAVVRTATAKLPDRVGAARTAALGLFGVTVGLVGLAVWRTPVGFHVATIVVAGGSAVLLPSTMLLAIDAAPEGERSQALATFTGSIDVISAVGPVALGLLAGWLSYSASFGAAALAAVLASVLLRRWWPAPGR